MANAYLGLGSNLGDRKEQLITATALLAERVGDVLDVSDFYETTPWGFQSENMFLNRIVRVDTLLSPYALLDATQQIEYDMGRTAKSNEQQYTDRTMDIDILLYDELILQSPTLVVPHPLMQKRIFVLQPLSEIAPGLIHPILNKTVTELYQELILHYSYSFSKTECNLLKSSR